MGVGGERPVRSPDEGDRMRGRTVGRVALLFVASVVAVAAALGVSAWSQAPLDPQSLIGDWNGSWTNKRAEPDGVSDRGEPDEGEFSMGRSGNPWDITLMKTK